MSDRPGIGGGDVGSVLGVNPHKTALDLWRQKVLREEDEETPAIRAGRRFEVPVLQAYAEAEGAELFALPPKLEDWRRYTPDSGATKDGWQVVVDAKTTALRTASDEVPPHIAAQLQWYLDGYGLDEAHVPTLEWPRDLRDYVGLEAVEIVALLGVRTRKLVYSPSLAGMLRDRADRFWHEHVLAEVPPPAADLADIKRLVRDVAGTTKRLSERGLAALAEMDGLKAEVRALEQRLERAEFVVREELRDVEAGLDGEGRPIVTLKVVERAAHAVKASRFRQLRTTKHWKNA